LLKLLITSISVKANINKETTDILITTSPEFLPLVKEELADFDLPLQYFILNIQSFFDAGCARLNIFKYVDISKYSNILYLDTDILLNSDVNVLFDLELSSEKIYALEEGIINYRTHGSQFFDHTKNDKNTTAFSSGVMLFKNSDCIKILFDEIQSHIEDYIYVKKNAVPYCLDQPFIVYRAMIQNKYDNQVLKAYVENNPNFVKSNRIVYHFSGDIGVYQSKLTKMTKFWEKMNEITKVLFQTSRVKLDTYILDMIKNQLGPSWKYEFYDDSDVIDFFIKNPISWLPDIIDKYNTIKRGAHRADLFRYYYLYIKGGFFMDSDAMLFTNINNIVRTYNFISVDSSVIPGSLFQGILGSSPKNEIIKQALFKAYITDTNELDTNYFHFCQQIYDILKKHNFGYSIKLYQEYRPCPHLGHDNILDKDTLLFKHYWQHKIIPSLENKSLENKKYSWGNNYITFLKYGEMKAFGFGEYLQLSTLTFQANFGRREHLLVFNDDYTEFTSTRKDDGEIIKGKILQ